MTRSDPRGRLSERCREPHNLPDPAAGEQRDHGRERVETERAPCGLAIDREGNLIRERVADEHRRHAVLLVEVRLEGQQAQHEITGGADAAHAALPPGPDLGTYVLHGAHIDAFQTARQRQVELRGVDADEDIRRRGAETPPQLRPQPQQPWQMLQHLGESHDGELLGARPRFAALRDHLRSRHSKAVHAGGALAQRRYERRTELIAGMLARHDADAQRRSSHRGPLTHRAHRTRLRVEA